MGTLVALEYTSIDGVVQAPGHGGEDQTDGFAAGGWTGPYMDMHGRLMVEPYSEAAAFLLGRITYEIWESYWPTVTDPGDKIAAALNSKPKYVASRTMTDPAWPGTTVIGADLEAEVESLKESSGGDILLPGSSKLAQSLFRAQLIDEYRLYVHPVVIGEGKRLFEGGQPQTLRLKDTNVFEKGLMEIVYARDA